MQVSYDRRADAIYIRLRHAPIDESDEVSKGVIVDYDRSGRPIGIEVLGASRLIGGHPPLDIDLAPAPLVKR